MVGGRRSRYAVALIAGGTVTVIVAATAASSRRPKAENPTKAENPAETENPAENENLREEVGQETLGISHLHGVGEDQGADSGAFVWPPGLGPSNQRAGRRRSRRPGPRSRRSSPPARRRASGAKRLGLSAVAVGGAAALAGHGAFATFTSAATGGPQTITTGTVTIALGAVGAANRLTVNASGVAPGDTIQRAVNLSNTGNLNLASITLGLSASPSSLLDTDATNGLQTTLQACSVAWTEGGTAPAYTYTCTGTVTSVLAQTAVATLKATPSSLSNLASLTAGGSDHLVVTLTLPTTAGNSFQNITSTLTYTFTGTQRAAQSD